MRREIRYFCMIFLCLSIHVRSQNTAREYFDAGTLKMDDSDYMNAIDDYTKAIALDSNFTDAYYNRGCAKIYLKDYHGAIADFSKAIENNFFHMEAFDRRAFAKKMVGDDKGAEEDSLEADAIYELMWELIFGIEEE